MFHYLHFLSKNGFIFYRRIMISIGGRIISSDFLLTMNRLLPPYMYMWHNSPPIHHQQRHVSGQSCSAYATIP